MIWISALTNIVQALCIITLVNQRHNLEQAIADFEWIAMKEYSK